MQPLVGFGTKEGSFASVENVSGDKATHRAFVEERVTVTVTAKDYLVDSKDSVRYKISAVLDLNATFPQEYDLRSTADLEASS